MFCCYMDIFYDKVGYWSCCLVKSIADDNSFILYGLPFTAVWQFACFVYSNYCMFWQQNDLKNLIYGACNWQFLHLDIFPFIRIK
jgi:hypothetical protein